jgi:glycosyltransferase involved in cell wall biosynthesis
MALVNDDRPQSDPAHLSLCAVVPTRNEAGNVGQVIDRLGTALAGVPSEILFVDDSDDETPTRVREAAATRWEPWVRLLHRSGAERAGGLGSAVLAGLRQARAEWVCVLDGDLQHPPEIVPEMLAVARASGADLVIATRYAGDGRSDGLSAGRGLASRGATAAARAVFPQRLRGVSDPMSGFFLVRRSALDLDALRPAGFKILLEILVAAPYLSTCEVSFAFADRHSGSSKAGWREGVRYGRSLARLRVRTLPAPTRPVSPVIHRRDRPVAPGLVAADGGAR